MEHLQEHPHAFLDTDGMVINVAVFYEHDENLIKAVSDTMNAVTFVCCCDNGLAQVGWKWLGTCWQPPKPNDGKNYEWSDVALEWVEIP